jgi:uncharacterized protein
MITRYKIVLPVELLLIGFFCSLIFSVAAQIQTDIVPERIAVSARPAADSITLRWAPLTFKVWQSGNRSGYRVERYVMSRDGKLLAKAEMSILAHSIKPFPESDWVTLANSDRYGAIAAQALFGARFEVDLKQSDVFTIVNKVQENEQRFAFALFSADMSPAVAKASGLWFTDTKIRKDEKYLYRIVVNSLDSLRGSVFTGVDEMFHLPEPQNLIAEFKEKLVTLKWDKSINSYYTAYLVERSDDGSSFKPIAETPLVSISPTPEENSFEYAIDSLPDLTKTYHYRVRGVTPFGEQSPPSRVVSGVGTPSVSQVPYISSAVNRNNTAILLTWEFPAEDNRAVKGFEIEASSAPKGKFVPLTQKLMPPEARQYEHHDPASVNYYRVTAHGLDGELYASPLYYAQLVDSLPPARPQGIKAQVDETGVVSLSWTQNTESDIFGYRVYKAFHQSEELAQVTTSPVPETSFSDTVNVKTLNENVYYRVMAVDINQNQSPLSELLNVPLPDKVRPQPPVPLPVKVSSAGVTLRWIPGSSEDIVQYNVYRKTSGHREWELLKVVAAGADTLYQFTDMDSAKSARFYTVVAIDDAGLESEPLPPITAARVNNILQPGITWKRPQINREGSQITLKWNYHQPGVERFRIFRSVDDEAPALFRYVAGDKNEFTDKLIPGQRYVWRIMAMFTNGEQSLLSEALQFQY